MPVKATNQPLTEIAPVREGKGRHPAYLRLSVCSCRS